MAWTSARTWIAGEVVTAALLNTHVRDNLNELRGGGLAIPSQTASDFLYASTSTQLARVGTAGAGISPKIPGSVAGGGWQLITPYPVGIIVEIHNDATNPATLFGFGTWASLGAGRVTVGIDPTQVEFDTAGETGGAKTHTLTNAEIPPSPVGLSGAPGSSNTIDRLKGGGETTTITTQGGGGAHNNLQPYIVVYRWVRTA